MALQYGLNPGGRSMKMALDTLVTSAGSQVATKAIVTGKEEKQVCKALALRKFKREKGTLEILGTPERT